MAGIAGDQFSTAHGGTDDADAISVIAAKLHEHKTDAIVYLKANAAAGAAAIRQRPYRIVGLAYFTFNDAGTEKLRAKAVATEATSAGTTGDDPLSPNWYVLREIDLSGNFIGGPQLVHEFDMQTLAEHQTLVDAVNDTWTDPS